MRVILFGAGASYGSGIVAPTPPPLGASLFRVLRRLYSSWRSIPEDTAGAFERHFEDGMQTVIDKHGFAIAPLMQDMAVFFAGFGLPASGDNRYTKLLRAAAGREDILWSTLNYECLLEIASSQLGRPVAYFAEPGKAGKSETPIWKLHGSCNFKVRGMEATRGVSFGSGVVFGGGIEPLSPDKVRGLYKGDTALYPAMALFARGKPVAMSPEPITEAQSRWAAHVAAADKIALVGVNPNPEDGHIWKPLAAAPGELGYVGGEEPYVSWRSSAPRTNPSRFLGTTWAVAERSVTEFLLD